MPLLRHLLRGVTPPGDQDGPMPLVARIGETRIGIHTPRRVHCGLSTKALSLCDFGRRLQHRHLERGDRETANLILWSLLGSSRARSIEDDNCCSQSCRSHTQDLFFHRSPPLLGVNSTWKVDIGRSVSNLWFCQLSSPHIPIPGVDAPVKSLHSPLCALRRCS